MRRPFLESFGRCRLVAVVLVGHCVWAQNLAGAATWRRRKSRRCKSVRRPKHCRGHWRNLLHLAAAFSFVHQQHKRASIAAVCVVVVAAQSGRVGQVLLLLLLANKVCSHTYHIVWQRQRRRLLRFARVVVDELRLLRTIRCTIRVWGREITILLAYKMQRKRRRTKRKNRRLLLRLLLLLWRRPNWHNFGVGLVAALQRAARRLQVLSFRAIGLLLSST